MSALRAASSAGLDWRSVFQSISIGWLAFLLFDRGNGYISIARIRFAIAAVVLIERRKQWRWYKLSWNGEVFDATHLNIPTFSDCLNIRIIGYNFGRPIDQRNRHYLTIKLYFTQRAW